jgi:FtsZ-binding cell division protein ZapB
MIKNGKIISNGDQTFNVPNTEEGKAFIKALRKFSNPKMKNGFACRGRGSRVEYAKKVGSFNAQVSVSHEFAEWFAVYMCSNVRGKDVLINELYTRIRGLENELKALKELGSVTVGAMGTAIGAIKEDGQTIKNLRDEIENLNQDFLQVIQEKDQYASEIRQLEIENQKLKSEKAYLQTVVKNNYNSMEKGITPVTPVSPISPISVECVTMTITVPKGSKIKFVEAT